MDLEPIQGKYIYALEESLSSVKCSLRTRFSRKETIIRQVMSSEMVKNIIFRIKEL
jgi:hypothetical protein